MEPWLAAPPLFGGLGQSNRELILLATAFALTAVIGLEREVRGKSGGMRTQAIVGTSAALIMLVGKFGFGDVLTPGTVILDPSRIAAQIVTGIGFLGAGLIITRRGAVHGLTTAAAVWECAAIGMASGAGLLRLAVVVTVMHFVIVLGFTPMLFRLRSRLRLSIRLHIAYHGGQGVLSQLLHVCETHHWQLISLAADSDDSAGNEVGAAVALSGPGVVNAAAALAGIAGVISIQQLDEESD